MLLVVTSELLVLAGNYIQPLVFMSRGSRIKINKCTIEDRQIERHREERAKRRL